MKISVSSNEVKQILEMHSKLRKKGLLEQIDDNEVDPKITGNQPESQVTKTGTETPVVNQNQIDRKLIDDSVKAGCLKNGTIRVNRKTGSPVYQAKGEKTGTIITFYPNMTYKIAGSNETKKWKCSKAEQAAQQAGQQQAGQQQSGQQQAGQPQSGQQQSGQQAVNSNQLKVLEFLKPLRWFNTPVPTEVEVDRGLFLKMNLANELDEINNDLSPEDKTLVRTYQQWFEKEFPNGFFVYKNNAGTQSPTDIARVSRVEVTIESCKNAIESLHNNLKSPSTFPLTNEERVAFRNTAKICIEPANKGKFFARFGLKSKVKELQTARVI